LPVHLSNNPVVSQVISAIIWSTFPNNPYHKDICNRSIHLLIILCISSFHTTAKYILTSYFYQYHTLCTERLHNVPTGPSFKLYAATPITRICTKVSPKHAPPPSHYEPTTALAAVSTKRATSAIRRRTTIWV
jgi:hypothetical protein